MSSKVRVKERHGYANTQPALHIRALGRWCGIDPSAMNYATISPFAYVAGNPVKYKDGDGRSIVDNHGNEAVIIGDDGKIHYTLWATDDIKTVVNAMILTDIGSEIVKNMVGSTNNIQIVLNTISQGYLDSHDNITDTPIGEDAMGRTTSYRTESGNLPDATITIYLKAIKREMDVPQGMSNVVTKDNTDIKMSKFSETEVIGATATHEGTHATDKTSNSTLNKDKMNTEAKPNANEGKFYKQADKNDRFMQPGMPARVKPHDASKDVPVKKDEPK